MTHPAPPPSDDEWPIAELRRQLGYLDGWVAYPNLTQISGARRYPPLDGTESIRIENAKSWCSQRDEISSEVWRVITFSEFRDDREIGKYIIRFDKVLNPDLRTLEGVQEFVVRQLGTADKSEWRQRDAELRYLAERNFSESVAEIDRRPWPRMPRRGTANYDAEYRAWSDGRREQERLTLEAHRNAYSAFDLHGAFIPIAEFLISMFCPREDISEVLAHLPGNGPRETVSNHLWHVARTAYALGREIRSREIAATHGLMVSYGKKSKDDRHNGAAATAKKRTKWHSDAFGRACEIRTTKPSIATQALADKVGEYLKKQKPQANIPSSETIEKALRKWETEGFKRDDGTVQYLQKKSN